MSDDAQASSATPEVPAAVEQKRPASKPPWVTGLAIITCVGIAAGFASSNEQRSVTELMRAGLYSAHPAADGAYWTLITSAFIHLDLIHLIFNLYWLWALGARLEITIGSLRYLGFYLAAAFVSSSFQLPRPTASASGPRGWSTPSLVSCG
jgi:GlpG protein